MSRLPCPNSSPPHGQVQSPRPSRAARPSHEPAACINGVDYFRVPQVAAQTGVGDVASVYRWMQRGLRGVRLEFTQIGGSRMISREQLASFIQATTAAARGEVTSTISRSPAKRDRDLARVDKQLDELMGDR